MYEIDDEVDEEIDEVEGENDIESICMELSSEMGFDIDVVRAALELHKGDLNAALIYLSSPSDALEGVGGTVLPSRVTRILSNSNMLRSKSTSRSNSSPISKKNRVINPSFIQCVIS